MRSPEVPAWWRWPLAGVALCLVAVSLLPTLSGSRFADPLVLLYVLVPASGVALVVGLAQGATRDRVAAGGAVALSVLLAAWRADLFSALFLVGLLAPLAVVVARPHRVASPLAALGLVAVLASALRAWDDRGPPVRDAWAWANVVGALVAALGLVAYVAAARAPATRPSTRGARMAVWGVGAALLAVSWALGGGFLFIPFWPLALALLAAPVAKRWRAIGTPALVVGAVLLAGLVPVGTCAFDAWSDAVPPGGPPPPTDRLVTLGQVGVHGPNWSSGGGFSGLRVACAPWQDVAGGAWAVALLGATGWAAWSPARNPKPQASA